MTKPPEKEAMRAELDRLLTGLEFYRSWVIAGIKATRGEVTQDDLNQIVMPAEEWRAIFDQTPPRQCHAIIKDVQQWYAHTAADLDHLGTAGGADTLRAVRDFYRGFRADVGFDFHAESGFLAKLLTRVTKAGRIVRHRDYEALKELEVDQDQKVVEAQELAIAIRLLRAYEDAHRPG